MSRKINPRAEDRYARAGLGLGVASGLATHVRVGDSGGATARFEPTVRSFSIAHDIGAAAWPAALVLMAVLEVTTRVAIVHVRGLMESCDFRVFGAGSPSASGCAS